MLGDADVAGTVSDTRGCCVDTGGCVTDGGGGWDAEREDPPIAAAAL